MTEIKLTEKWKIDSTKGRSQPVKTPTQRTNAQKIAKIAPIDST